MTAGVAAQVYIIANIAIGIGYLAVPVLVLPFLDLRRRTLVFGTLFFVGCFGSHLDMIVDVLRHADLHPPVGWMAASWHVMQAIGTWGFIITFRRELAKANALLDQVGLGESHEY